MNKQLEELIQQYTERYKAEVTVSAGDVLIDLKSLSLDTQLGEVEISKSKPHATITDDEDLYRCKCSSGLTERWMSYCPVCGIKIVWVD